MSTLPALAITGSTGAVGGLVAARLAADGLALRLLARSPDRAPQLAGAVAVPCSYGDGEASRAALEGVSVLFMVSGAEAPDRLEQHRAFVDAAADAGVEHIIYTSFFGAALHCTFTLGRDHYATEQHIKSAGVRYTFLRDNFYLEFLPMVTGEDGVIRGPAGHGRVAAVAREDVARSAVAVLRHPGEHLNATYDLTGRQSLTFTEVAKIITAATGRVITFHDETLEEAYASRRPWQAPDWQNDAWVSTYTAIAHGELAGITDHVEQLTGRPPLTLAQLLAGAPRSS